MRIASSWRPADQYEAARLTRARSVAGRVGAERALGDLEHVLLDLDRVLVAAGLPVGVGELARASTASSACSAPKASTCSCDLLLLALDRLLDDVLDRSRLLLRCLLLLCSSTPPRRASARG